MLLILNFRHFFYSVDSYIRITWAEFFAAIAPLKLIKKIRGLRGI